CRQLQTKWIPAARAAARRYHSRHTKGRRREKTARGSLVPVGYASNASISMLEAALRRASPKYAPRHRPSPRMRPAAEICQKYEGTALAFPVGWLLVTPLSLIRKGFRGL